VSALLLTQPLTLPQPALWLGQLHRFSQLRCLGQPPGSGNSPQLGQLRRL